MRNRSSFFTIALTFLATLIVVIVTYVLFRFTQTNTMPTTPVQQTPTATPVDPGRAFIRIVSATSPIAPGGTYTVVLDTNEWSTCAVDVYRPDQTNLILTKEDAKPQPISPGRMTWTWNVPRDAQMGAWLTRILCGTADNLATLDQKVEVR